ncbi:5'-methylthioadenosine/adenosylhomocysteine nucleosidase [Lagierella sp.]|uniref:5'-methylthioadenosine/adenosylhomocysteine nucleosidase n=1 Tax=Lagierella sp. TaxID=2849657 RepID=UPI002613181C|nr:5'-methylthioadenosine/adenosylhomocysteine nucleosidase [Lagierella sp.]
MLLKPPGGNTVVIICAMESEIEFFKDKIEIFSTEYICKRKVYEGLYNGKKIVFSDCGVGKVNSSMLTQALIDRYNPYLIINSGIAGALDDRLKHLDLVIGKELTYHDYELRLLEKYSPYVRSFKADSDLLKKFESLIKDGNYYEGLIITGDKFVVDNETKNRLKTDFNALCVEMEGAAIAHVCYLNDVKFLVIRSISDLADSSGDEDYDKFEFIAGRRAAELTLNYIGK